MILLGLLTVILAILGTPLFIVIAANAILHLYFNDLDLSLTMIEFYRLANMPMLLPIPLFTFAGYVLAQSGTPRRLVRLSQATLGWIPGGLAIVCLIACALFTSFTGASGVTIVALGGLLFPALVSESFGGKFSLGLITTSGSLGLLFPPSLPLILYGVVAGTSIDELFIGGVLPGCLIIGLLALACMLYARKRNIPRQSFSLKELMGALLDAKYEIPLPFVVILGIYSGKFAISEAAALTTFLVVLIEVLLYRDIKFRDLPGIMQRSMILVGSVMIIMGCSLAYTNYLLDAEVPIRILDVIKVHITSPLGFLIALNIFLLIVGCMLDIFSAIIVVVPLIVPIASSYGIDPVHLGIIFLANLNIGYLTPPVGMNLFISSIRFKQPIVFVYRAAFPFLLILLVSLLMITYIPEITLCLLHRS